MTAMTLMNHIMTGFSNSFSGLNSSLMILNWLEFAVLISYKFEPVILISLRFIFDKFPFSKIVFPYLLMFFPFKSRNSSRGNICEVDPFCCLFHMCFLYPVCCNLIFILDRVLVQSCDIRMLMPIF